MWEFSEVRADWGLEVCSVDLDAMLVTMKEQLELWDGEGAIDIGDGVLERLDKEQRQMRQRDKQHENTVDLPGYERALRISVLIRRVNGMVKKAIDEGSEPDFQEAVRELKEAIQIWRDVKPDVQSP